MTLPRLIQQLKCTVGNQEYNAGIRVMGFVQRGIGIWPNQVTVRICERERQLLPTDLYGLTFSIKLGTDEKSVEIFDWRLIDITETNHGTTADNPANRDLEWDFTLEDGRWRLQNDRGGLLMQGVLNPTLPDGSINPALRYENHELVEMCLAAIPMTHREGALAPSVITKMDQVEPMAEVVWRGAHAPTQLQRLLEWTRCAFCYNQNGTYSIHALTDPPFVPSSPYIPEVAKLPGSVHTIVPPDHEGKCIIASCPTRHLIQRVRTLYQASPYEPPRPLQWVGVEIDGSIQPLTDLSWWPSGKTPLQVFQGKFASVADDYRRLAESCVFRMVRLHDDDLAEDWTLVERLVDQNFATSNPRGEPLGVLVLSNAAFQDKHGAWMNPSTPIPVEGVRLDLDRGVFIFDRPQVRLSVSRSHKPEQDAQEFSGAQLAITFGHHPNAGDYTDYFMATYQWDENTEAVIKIADPDPPDPPAIVTALAEGVPVYRFPDLQLNYIEQAHPSTDIDVDNDTEIEALALGYAKALITAQQAKFSVQEYPGLHNVDPDHSTTLVVWDPNELMTAVHLGRHQPITADYLGRLIDSRSTHGGRAGSPAGGTAAGLARSASTVGGSLGPSTGARAASRVAVNHVPAPVTHIWPRRFFAKITGKTGPSGNKWSYSFTEVYKSATGAGASAWTVPTNPVTGTAGNLFELINDATGANYLGIGVTNDELNDTANSGACALDVRPVPTNVIVEMLVIDIFTGAGTVTTEYWFQWANGVYEEP